MSAPYVRQNTAFPGASPTESGVLGLLLMAVRKSVAAALVGADAQYGPLQTDDNGALRCTLAGAATGSTVAISQTTPGTTNRTQVGGTKAIVSASKTRPGDTTAYTAKDAIAESTSAPTVWTFTGMARTLGLGGYITRATLSTDQTTCSETFRLHLFNAAPTALNDNAACTAPLYAAGTAYVGTINFPAAKTEGTGATAAYANVTPNTPSGDLPLEYVTAADANLYGLLETPNGFTPANGQKFTIIFAVEQD